VPTVAVIRIPGQNRSERLCVAMAAGIEKLGDKVILLDYRQYTRPVSDIAVFYGFHDPLPRVMADYTKDGRHAVFLDLGYWGRWSMDSTQEYHKVIVDDRHPNAYFQKVRHKEDRIRKFSVRPRGWKTGRDILLLGMSAKSAGTVGYQPQEWEENAVAEIRKHTDRPITYRPKPSWKDAKPIAGTKWAGKERRLLFALRNCHAVVSHHSNAAVDSLVEGYPSFCWDGVAAPMSLQDLSRIDNPIYPDRRDQWLADIAYCQWTPAEMASGVVWQHLKDEGLIP